MLEHFKLQHANHADDDFFKADAGPLERLNRAFLGKLQHALDLSLIHI